MTLLITGIAIFFAVHAIPMAQPLRSSLAARLGQNGFKAVFTIFSIASFAAIVAGMKGAPFDPVWNPPAWSMTATGLLMPVAFYLLVAAYAPNNIRRIIRNPMLSATFLWALAHLLSNGDLASILLFGSFGTFAIVDILSVNRRAVRPALERKPLFSDVLTIATGLLAFCMVRYFHGAIFGVPVSF
jgi:uncharacterized membrane protein